MEAWQKARSVDIIGPFEEHYVVIDGYRVPYLTAMPLNGGRLHVTVNHHSTIEMSVADAEHVLPWVADCIAVASGFVSRPDGDEVEKPFPRPLFVRMHGIVTETSKNREPE